MSTFFPARFCLKTKIVFFSVAAGKKVRFYRLPVLLFLAAFLILKFFTAMYHYYCV